MKLEKILGFLLFLYLMLSPFYLWSSGLPQIADLILMIFVIISIFTIKNISKFSKMWIFSLFLIFYVSIVNMIWSIVLSSVIIMPIMFLIYNLLVMLIMTEKINKNPTFYFNILLKGVASSIFLQFAISMIYVGDRSRVVLFFNNPNQLAFFVLLMSSVLFIIYRIKKINSTLLITYLLFSSYLMILSVSQGAIVSFIILIILFLIFESHDRRTKFKLGILTGGVLLAAFFVFSRPGYIQGHNPHLDFLIQRVETNSQRNPGGLLSGRGYERIFNYPEYLVFGAGEGEFWRFDNSIVGLELHSTIGSMFFSYGLIGFSIFLLLLCYIIKRSDIKFSYPLIPIFIYGLTHNGIRQTLFWMILALLITINKENRFSFLNTFNENQPSKVQWELQD